MVDGFVDLHTHGLGPAATGDISEVFLRDVAAAHGTAGTSGILLTLYPREPSELRDEIEFVAAFMERSPVPGSAAILGVHLEGPFCNPARAGALDPASFRPPVDGDVALLLDGLEEVVRVITIAPELPGATGFIHAATERGVKIQMGHSDATWEEARRAKEAGAVGVTHLFNAMAPLHHRSPGLVGFALWDPDLYVELIPDGEHVADSVIDLILRLKSRNRVLFVSDSVPGPRKGTAVRSEKGTLLGGGRALGELASRLRERGIPEDLLRAGARDNPLRYLGLE